MMAECDGKVQESSTGKGLDRNDHYASMFGSMIDENAEIRL